MTRAMKEVKQDDEIGVTLDWLVREGLLKEETELRPE